MSSLVRGPVAVRFAWTCLSQHSALWSAVAREREDHSAMSLLKVDANADDDAPEVRGDPLGAELEEMSIGDAEAAMAVRKREYGNTGYGGDGALVNS